VASELSIEDRNMPTTNFTTAEAAAQITRSGYTWSAAPGTPVTLTYGFRQTAPLYNSSHNEATTFSQSTDAQKASFEMALGLWSDVANITFTAVNPTGYTDDAVLLFANYTNPGDGAGGFTFSPATANTFTDSIEGDVWINNPASSAGSQPLGSYNFMAIIHELGHALGLEHPGDYAAAAGVIPTYNNDAAYVEDSLQYSIMSYFDAYNTGAQHYVSLPANPSYGATPLLHDIAAIQALYGANTTTRTGDTVYGFNSTAGRASFDFAVNSDPVVAIWDAGGTHDVLDVSQYTTNQVIDLHAGTFSNVGRLTKNVAIADGTTIEDAVGGTGNDTMSGNEVANNISGNAGNDKIYGYEGNDTLSGGAGADVIDGGIGNDTMTGGDGIDTYYVDSGSDVVTEATISLVTGGNDIVISTATYTLGANIERLTLSGVGTINGTGNALANTLTGNGAANVLTGLAGNDVLNGGLGSDKMYGGDGTDTYYVDSSLDTVTETNALLSTGGNDLVISTITYTLGANVERLTLTGVGVIYGTGNALANTLTGNQSANTLTGLAGNDILDGGVGTDNMYGGDGNDVYYVDNGLDYVSETNADLITGGNDLIISTVRRTLGANVERLTLSGTGAIEGTGNQLDNVIVGNIAANTLSGLNGNDSINAGAGDDILFGGPGNDTLTGGAGKDVFVFNSALSSLVNRDVITDFAAVDDTIRLENAVFLGLGSALGTLAAAKFWASAAGVAHDLDDRIIYNTATGVLNYDSNGSAAGGTTAQFAVLTAHPVITSADFVVV
jgi:Ca2+-binding RTX toxin-like protein